MSNDQLTSLQQWHHDSQWSRLGLLLEVEYRREFCRAAMRKARTPIVGFKVSPELRKLPLLKGG